MGGPDDAPAQGRGDPVHLMEENRLLAQRYLELEETSRRQLEKLRAANDLLARGESHMRRLMEKAAMGFALLDANLRIVSVNRTLAEMLGVFERDLPGESFASFVYVGKLPLFTRLVADSANRVGSREMLELVARDGKLVACRIAVSDWLDEEGIRRGAFVLVSDAGHESEMRERIRSLEETVAEQEKSRQLFLDVVSRELRAPANGIMGMIRMMMDVNLSERQAELAGVIHSSASSLAKLVDDMVDLARLDASDVTLEPEPLSPAGLARGVGDLFGVRAEEKGLEMAVEVADTVPPLVVGDVTRLRRVLVHLLDNAFKYTERGRVALNVDKIGDSLRFMVSDTGSGMEVKPGADIFSECATVDSPSSRRHGGLGLGLSICRKLVTLMGGKIGYDTEPGRGSEFHFTIPVVVPEADGSAELSPPPEAMRLAPMSILLADGNPLSRRIINAYLQFDNHRLALADNGVDAAGQCRNVRFDLVILDLVLPKLDGMQTLRLIRDEEKASGRKRTPVLLIGGHDQLRERDFYLRNGADGVVAKPVRPVELMAAAAAATGAMPLSVSRRKAPGQYAAETSGASLRRVNGDQLYRVRQIMQEDELIGILRFFMEDAVPGLIGLADMAAAAEPDMERIAFGAGKMRGLSGYLGFAGLAELLGRVEDGARNGEAETLRRLAEELPLVIDDTLEELKRILPDAFATLSAMAKPSKTGSAAGSANGGGRNETT